MFILVFLIIIAAILCSVLGHADAIQKQKKRDLLNAEQSYRDSLAQLSDEPANTRVHNETLSTGRTYANLTRNNSGVTVFDEVALMNDIRAACANTASLQPQNTSTSNIEERLLLLNELLAKQLITQSEFDRKRDELLACV
jgi:hypothetical protein